MPRPSNTHLRREQIIDGLATAMAESGYEKATISAIARSCGLTPGLLHYHFRNKQAILLALVEQLVSRVQQRYPNRGTPAERLDGFIDAHLALGPDADPRSTACWVIIGAEAVRQPAVREAYRSAVEQMLRQAEHRIRDVLGAEQQPTDRVEQLAAALIAAFEGAYQLGVTVPDALPVGFAAETIKQLIRGLTANVGGQPRSQ